jgi:hypothetical protein
LEALLSSFLYRSPFLPAENRIEKNYHETSSLRFYRKKLEEKAVLMDAQITAAKGQGAKINLPLRIANNKTGTGGTVLTGRKKRNGIEFLEKYRNDIASLCVYGKNNLEELDEKSRQIFLTLLPYAAAVKHRNPALKTDDLIEHTKQLCIEDINRMLS